MRRPIGIAIISILNFAAGIYSILVGLGVTSVGAYGFFADKGITTETKTQLGGIGIAGIVTLVLGIITILVAIGLWKLKTWAWYFAFLITAFHLVNWIYAGVTSAFSTIIIIHIVAYGVLTLYLLAVKKHFGSAN